MTDNEKSEISTVPDFRQSLFSPGKKRKKINEENKKEKEEEEEEAYFVVQSSSNHFPVMDVLEEIKLSNGDANSILQSQEEEWNLCNSDEENKITQNPTELDLIDVLPVSTTLITTTQEKDKLNKVEDILCKDTVSNNVNNFNQHKFTGLQDQSYINSLSSENSMSHTFARIANNLAEGLGSGIVSTKLFSSDEFFPSSEFDRIGVDEESKCQKDSKDQNLKQMAPPSWKRYESHDYPEDCGDYGNYDSNNNRIQIYNSEKKDHDDNTKVSSPTKTYEIKIEDVESDFESACRYVFMIALLLAQHNS